MADNNYEIDVTLEETFGTGVRSVEQTATSAESGGMNEITVTLTNDQENKFYIMNGLAGKDGRDGGFPVAVGEASLMTDTSKIYLYVGIEEGYTQNHLYYWDGEAWHDYGTYGAPADYLRSASVTHEQGLDQLGNTTYTTDTLTLEGNADGVPAETEFVQKLYYSAGENVDGALTQKATSEAIESAQYLPIVNHPNAPVGDTALSVELQQNVMNVIGGVGYAFTTITMTLATKKAGRVNRYFGRFTTGGNAFAVTWPTGVTVPSALSYKTQTTYDFVIEDSILHVWEDGNAVGDVLDATATANAVSTWLTNHPEATTTVADGSITTAKLASGVIDQTLTVQGAAADSAKVGQELSDLKSQIEQSGGLTSAIKSALLQLAQKVAYIDDDGQTYYDDLYDALYPPIVVTNITLNTNSLSFATLNSTQQLTATTTPTGGAVTWSSSNTSVATVSATGLVTAIGYGNATITATSGSISATCSVAIAQATVTSISAVYTQSGTVYDTDSLESLKSDLVVTATWSNQTTSTVDSADYTLSGTLTEGTSTITVTYGGKTATFSVTVTRDPYVYKLTSEFVSTGANSEATNVQLATEQTVTVLIDFTATTIHTYSSTRKVEYILSNKVANSDAYLGLQTIYSSGSNYLWGLGIGYSAGRSLITPAHRNRFACVLTINADGSSSCSSSFKDITASGAIRTFTNNYNTGSAITANAYYLGKEIDGAVDNGFVGTVHDFRIYDGEMSSADITDYLTNGAS